MSTRGWEQHELNGHPVVFSVPGCDGVAEAHEEEEPDPVEEEGREEGREEDEVVAQQSRVRRRVARHR